MRLAILAILALATLPAVAQEAEEPPYDPAQYDVANGKDVFQNQAVCLQCHGWDGAGRGANPRAPLGPNLRETTLDHVLLREVIACGRPDTEMPYHDAQAYSDGRCYGLTMADFEEGDTPSRGKTITDEEIDDLVAYLVAEVVGKGETTLAECEAFFRPGHRNCRGLE